MRRVVVCDSSKRLGVDEGGEVSHGPPRPRVQRQSRCSLIPACPSSIHKGVKNYECELCGARFRTRNQVKYHELKHSSTRDYYCVECDSRSVF